MVPYTQSLVDKHGLKPLYLESGDKVLLVKAFNYFRDSWNCVRCDVLRFGDLESYVEESPHVHVIGYHSNMAYSNMSVTRHTMLEDVKCSMCGGQKMHYRFVDDLGCLSS